MAYKCQLKPSNLEHYLQQLSTFNRPKVNLEQYSTSAHLAAQLLTLIQSNYGDIEDCLVADLGSGAGILTAGASLLGAAHCIGFEVDQEAIQLYRDNMELLDLDNTEAILCDILQGSSSNVERWRKTFDTVITNPPFGTREYGADVEFLNVGLELAQVVYSLHKTSTRRYVMKKARQQGYTSVLLAELKFDLPKTYGFHSKKSFDIQVDLIRSFK